MNTLRSLTCLAMIVLPTLLPAAPTDWSFAPVATVGVGGFTSLIDARVGDDGTIVVRGERDGVTGLYRVTGGGISAVVTVGTVLPDGLGTVSALSLDYAVDPSGRVVFSARVSGGALPASDEFRTFRAADGVIVRMLPGDGFIHAPRTMTSDGRWLVDEITGSFPTHEAHTLHLTDGATPVRLFDYTQNPAGACRFSHMTHPSANSAGSVLQHFSEQSSDVSRDGSGNIICGVNEGFSRVWSMSVVEQRGVTGSTFTSVAFGSRSVARAAGVDFGSENRRAVGLINDAGSVAWRREVYEGPPLFFGDDNPPARIQLVLKDASGERVIVESPLTDAARFDQLLGLDPVGRVAFTTLDQSTSEVRLFSGPDLARDRVLGTTDRLFGSPLQSFSPLAVNAPPGTFGDKRIFLFRYTLDDPAGTQGIARASKQGSRWANRNGGAWATAANWSPEEVPGSASEVLFDLDASYDVTVGTQSAGRAVIENGSVSFRSPALTLVGPLLIGSDASLTQPQGKITAGELTIGSLPPVDPARPPTARFFLSNKDTEFITSGPAVIGSAGHGELFISDATMTSGEVRLGAGSPGLATVGSSQGRWATGNIAIGFSDAGTLNIERGAAVISDSAVIGAGTELVDKFGKVSIDNTGAPSGSAENWLVRGDLTIGTKLQGHLEVFHGGLASVRGSLRTGFADHDIADDAIIDLLGVGAPGPSQLVVAGDLELAVSESADTDVTIVDGAELAVSRLISVAHANGSFVQITINGIHANGSRSRIVHASPSEINDFILGHRGKARMEVRNGGRVETSQLVLGDQAGSEGTLLVDGIVQGIPSSVVARFISVGGSPLVSNSRDASGNLTLGRGGVIETRDLFVAGAGTVRGDGTIIVTGSTEIFGTIEPASGLTPEIRQGTPSRARKGGATIMQAMKVAETSSIGPGTLTFQGDVTLSSSATVALDVNGSAPDAADRLVVMGALTLGGTLVLNFANGYAPRTGETLDLISSTSTTGSFATTTITGLEPGFQFTLAPDGSGGVRLAAVNDGVSATAVGSRLSNLSVRTALADAQNLIVGFVVSGGAKPVLVRAAGPGLATMVEGIHPDPRITLFNSAGNAVDSNDDWPEELAATMQALGAFPFASASTDAALLRSANAAYTAHVNGPGSGIVLVELYDAQTGVSPRLINASARNRVGTGADILIAGFVIEGSSPKTVLVRGVGPGLAGLDMTGTLADPLLTVFEGGSPLDQNDDWPVELASVFASVGAFELPAGSKDAALLVTLAPGIYTAQVSGVGATTGEALVEVYEVP